jgi:hypothetical protein
LVASLGAFHSNGFVCGFRELVLIHFSNLVAVFFFLSALFGSSLNFNFYIGVVFQWIFSPFSFAEVPAEQLRWFFPTHRAY